MKRILTTIILCAVLSARADSVYRAEQDFLTTADLDGDGNSDIVLVDGSNVTVRVGYQTSTTNLLWASPRSLGIDSVSCIGCGSVLNGGDDILVATTPLLNRLHLYNLDSPTAIPSPVSAHVTGIGPESFVVMDIGGASNTVNDDICSFSILNGVPSKSLSLIRSDGTQLYPLVQYPIYVHVPQSDDIEFKTGEHALGLIYYYGAGETFGLYSLAAGDLDYICNISMSLTNNPSYISFIPTGDSYAQFIAWEPRSSNLATFEVYEPGAGNYALTNYAEHSAAMDVNYMYIVQGAGIKRLVMVFTDGTATVFNYDGSAAPLPIQNITPPVGESIIGILPLGTNDFISVSSTSGDLSGDLTVEQQTFIGTNFVSVKSTSLPAVSVKSRANVMTFEHEPFVDSVPRRLQLMHAGGDWAKDSQILAGNVSATIETDRGIAEGLGNPQAVTVGAANAAAAYTMDNQLADNISAFSLENARGDEVLSIVIAPDPGMYGKSIEVSFVTEPTTTVYYRVSSADSWIEYSVPFTLFKDTTVQYFAAINGSNSIIHEAAYNFSETPDDLDSDGDGVPDYVEVANGLDPVNSGLDSDGDGVSDFDELMAGTSPTNAASVTNEYAEFGAVYDLAVTMRPYDGYRNMTTTCRVGAQLRAYSAAGGQFAYAKATNLVLGASVTNPATLFEGLSQAVTPPFVVAVSDTRIDLASWTIDNYRGSELVGIYLQPDIPSLEINYSYQDGALEDEASNWLAAAGATYTNQSHYLQVEELGVNNTLVSMLTERKIADLLYIRGTITNSWCSLFKGRTADNSMTGLSSSDVQSLEVAGPGDEPAYHIPDMISYFNDSISAKTNLLALTDYIYDAASYWGGHTNYTGQYPLPADVLRAFLYSGDLQSNYLAKSYLSGPQITDAYNESTQLLAMVESRPVVHFTLVVATNSFDAACPVLYPIGGGTGKSLYDANGNPYRFPITFTLQPGAQVSLDAYSDVDWVLCPGTDPLEVIALDLTAVPTATGADEDGNLLPDDYEAIFLVGSGGSATNDLDGDGYSDLQEYLDQSDPADASSHGTTPVSMAPPEVRLALQSGSTYNFQINWPAAYAGDFVFILEYTDDLNGTPFAQEEELPEGSLTTIINSSTSRLRFYRAKMYLR